MSSSCILPVGRLQEWAAGLVARYRVLAPKERSGVWVFEDYLAGAPLDLSYPLTQLSPKKCLIAPRQVLYRYDTDGHRLVPEISAVPTVILGVHTCDQHAIRLMDRILSQGFPDQHYQAQREQTLLVGIDCAHPCSPQSFCRSMGTANPATGAFDLHLTLLGNDYWVDIGSAKGAALFEGFHGVFPPSEQDALRRDQVLRDKWQAFPYRLDFDVTELPGLMAESTESALWQRLGDRCLACGACTQVCPTCYCFDVSDEVSLDLTQGERARSWDSCQINDFAVVAGGHNFRQKRAARQRHRFMRKGKYQYDATDTVGCVGCGRCASACLVGITPLETFNELWQLRRARHGEEEGL